MSAIKKARCESQTSTLSDLTPIQLISWRRLPRCPAMIGGNERTPAVHFLSRIAVALEPMNLLVIFKQTECRRWFRLHFRHADWLSEYLIHFLVLKADWCSIWKNWYYIHEIFLYYIIRGCIFGYLSLYIFHSFTILGFSHIWVYIQSICNFKQLHLPTRVSFFARRFLFLIHMHLYCWLNRWENRK